MNKLNVLNTLLVGIKNAYSNKNKYAYCKLNSFCVDVLWVLYKEDLIYDFYVDKVNLRIQIRLKYFKNKPLINNLNLISKPSLYYFYAFDKLKTFEKNYDYFFMSTSNGIISSKLINKNLNIGGIILFGLKLNI